MPPPPLILLQAGGKLLAALVLQHPSLFVPRHFSRPCSASWRRLWGLQTLQPCPLLMPRQQQSLYAGVQVQPGPLRPPWLQKLQSGPRQRGLWVGM